jgi:predicted methyltransferase
MLKKSLLFVVLVATHAACSSSPESPDEPPVDQVASDTNPTPETKAESDSKPIEELLKEAAEGEHRSPSNIARNAHRHPVETLMFFGIQPNMTVVELWSGGGWYTEVLAPVLSQEGTLVAANFAAKDDPNHYRSKLRVKMDERIANDPVFAKVVHGTFEPGVKVDAGEPGSADMVLTFRNMHSFINAGIEKEVIAEAYKVLKPGGVFGVVQHRAPDGSDPKVKAKTGYVSEAFVIELAEEVGFELEEKSEVNANPKDTTEHPEGVWTLQPSLRLGEQDKEKYMAIGESDRMTLKFRKPAE